MRCTLAEVTLQLSPPLTESIREIANKQFEGSMPAVLKATLELYVNNHTKTREHLKKVVQQIRQEVEARSGIDEKDLEQRINEYRRIKYSKPQ